MELLRKIKRRLWGKLVIFFRSKKMYPLIYRGYWHSIFSPSKELLLEDAEHLYYTAKPNYGAGIGHQMANWIAGYWYAKQFNLKFSHVSFSSKKWENFLGFGNDEVTLEKLIQIGYKKVKLPLFNEENIEEVCIQKKIISSYKGKKVVFIAETNQFYKDQYGVVNEIQQKFYKSISRKQDNLIYEDNCYNLAIHVRRGDIVAGQNKIDNHTMRWLANEYFESVLQNTLDYIKTDKKVNIYLFSQGKEEDFKEFRKFKNLHFCLDMGAMDSFLHMVYADALIISKSSFSYKPALLSKGLKVVPKDFWHGYPNTPDFVMVDNNGVFL